MLLGKVRIPKGIRSPLPTILLLTGRRSKLRAMTEPEPLQQCDRTYVRVGGRKLSYFSGCDYFRLASHPAVLQAVQSGLKRYGLNVAASRLTTGNHSLYQALERQLETFFGAEDALLVSTGYLTNLVVAQALAGSFSHALLDERSHSALADAAPLFDCPILRFKHRQLEDLARTVRRCGAGAKLILLTDGMFSHDGSAAPLKDYRRVLPKDAWMLVDDAHGAGVLGASGKGALEQAGTGRARIIQTITLSKAFGAYGGGILGTRRLRRLILDRSSIFIGSTPLPLPLANAALQSVRLLQSQPSLRARLRRNTSEVKLALTRAGMRGLDTPGPIIRLIPTCPAAAASLNRALQAERIYPPFIKYPGGPSNGYFRFVISSEHTPAQLQTLIRALRA